MRVTEKIVYDAMRFSVMENRDRLFAVQQRIAANRKLASPSDDPRGSEKASQLHSTRAELEQFRRNIRFGKTSLEISDTALQGVEDLLVRAKELAVQFSNGEFSDRDRKMAAEEVGEIRRQVVGYANTKNGSEYVFSGFLGDTPAYSAAGVWQGDAGAREIRIGQSERIVTNETGADIFGSAAAAGGVPAGGLMKDLQDFQAALENNDLDGVRNALTTMDAGMQAVLAGRALAGTRIRRMEVTDTAIGNMLVAIDNQLSGIEDLDIAEMATELAKQEAVLQAAVQVAGRIGSLTVLDAVKR